MSDESPKDEARAPYFPPPRKPEKLSPYRKKHALLPLAEPNEKRPLIVTRPEPPAALTASRPKPAWPFPLPPREHVQVSDSRLDRVREKLRQFLGDNIHLVSVVILVIGALWIALFLRHALGGNFLSCSGSRCQ
jgi:hypothetical protein